MSVSDLTDAQTSAWYAFSTPDGAPARDTFNRGFNAGARWAIRTSSELSPHLAKFLELLVLLGFDQPTE